MIFRATCLLSGILLLAPLGARAKPRFAFESRFLARHARHVDGSAETSNLMKLDLIQKMRMNQRWTASAGLRQEVESVYGEHPERYVGEVGERDSQMTWPKETWVRYSSQILSATVGYQTVVWGEAFGTAFADMVNPKDYRELGVEQLGETRIPLPMANIQWVWERQSLQILILPEARHHLLPLRGSEFSGLPDNFKLLRSQPDFGRGDAGLKYGFRVGDADIAILALRAADRFPVYSAAIVGADIVLKPEYRDLTSAGLTLTSDLQFALLRVEVVKHLDRELQAGGLGFSQTIKSDELVGVLGVDLTQFPGWQVNLQYSEFLLDPGVYLLRKQRESMGSLRLAYTFANDGNFEVLFSHRFDERATLFQPSVTFPASNSTEFSFGADFFGGDKDTVWGALKDATRFYIKFVGYLKG